MKTYLQLSTFFLHLARCLGIHITHEIRPASLFRILISNISTYHSTVRERKFHLNILKIPLTCFDILITFLFLKNTQWKHRRYVSTLISNNVYFVWFFWVKCCIEYINFTVITKCTTKKAAQERNITGLQDILSTYFWLNCFSKIQRLSEGKLTEKPSCRFSWFTLCLRFIPKFAKLHPWFDLVDVLSLPWRVNEN